MHQELLKATATALPTISIPGARVEPLAETGGSDRRYFRIHLVSEESLIVMEYTDQRPDNLKFIPASKMLAKIGNSIPEILHHDSVHKRIWLEDLGNRHLWDYREAPWSKRRRLYKAAIDEISILHSFNCDQLNASEESALEPPFDEALYNWEQDYFFEHFLGNYSRRAPSYIGSLRHEEEFSILAKGLAALPTSLVHRDFQSQNILLRDGRPYIIDYQGLRFGLPAYDIAALLHDPYAPMEEHHREELINYAFRENHTSQWHSSFNRCAAQRLMQALGAYAMLANNTGKVHFLQYIPTALESLRTILEKEVILPRLLPYLSDEAISV
ncbi:MAG: phosphotransferase [Verrucomicrobiaceae bacterium]|nr:phosphotransferase [Verrucomicrobiaceae bacterium]